MAVAFEVVDPRVFQEAPNDRVNLNVIVQNRQVVAQTSNPANQQANLDPGRRRLVEVGDDLLIGERIHLHADPGRIAPLGDRNLLVNLLVDEVANAVRRRVQLVEIPGPRKTR